MTISPITVIGAANTSNDSWFGASFTQTYPIIAGVSGSLDFTGVEALIPSAGTAWDQDYGEIYIFPGGFAIGENVPPDLNSYLDFYYFGGARYAARNMGGDRMIPVVAGDVLTVVAVGYEDPPIALGLTLDWTFVWNRLTPLGFAPYVPAPLPIPSLVAPPSGWVDVPSRGIQHRHVMTSSGMKSAVNAYRKA